MNSRSGSFDPTFMDEALALAAKRRPSPNPRVGAIVVLDGQVIGRGFHEQPGKPHAETIALDEAGIRAKGADLYVTLEPCSHQGHTKPCVDRIIKDGISRVAVGLVDPDERVNGNGIAILQGAGIQVVSGIRKEECERLLAGYITHRTTGLPLVTLKAAITLDGKIATHTGNSMWISSQKSRNYAHQMRAEADAVLVGVETVVYDDPLLTVRNVEGSNPVRVVMDSHLRIPIESKLLASADQADVILAYTDASEDAVSSLGAISGVETIRCSSTVDGRVSPPDLLKKLGQRGILSLLVEGGGRIHGAFAQARLADRVALFIAPKILGSGHSWISLPQIPSIQQALQLTQVSHTSIGDDVLIEGAIISKK